MNFTRTIPIRPNYIKSPFQDLCELVELHGDDVPFSDLLRLLRQGFNRKPITLNDQSIAMQMPPETNVLTKRLVLKRAA